MLTPVLRFDGRRFAHLAPSPVLSLTNCDFTIEAWIKPDPAVPPSMGMAVLTSTEPVPSRGLYLGIRSGRLYFGFFANDTPGQMPIPPGVFTHIAARYSLGTGEQAIFVNGVLDIATKGHPPYQGLSDLLIGQAFNGEFFVGWIAEVRIWGYARADADIAGLRAVRLTGNEAGLRGYWPMNDGTGPILRDGRGAGAMVPPPLSPAGLPPYAGFPPPPSPPPPGVMAAQILPDVAWAQDDISLATSPLVPAATIDALVQDNQSLRGQVTQLNGQLQQLHNQIGDLLLNRDATAATMNALQTERGKLADQVAALTAQLGAMQQARDAALADNQRLGAQLASLSDNAGAHTLLDKFITDANSSVTAARQALQQQGSAYSLGSVKLDIKMIPVGDGRGLYFPSPADMKGIDAGQLSVMTVELVSNERADAPSVTPVEVPDLTGYTEVLARRKLGEVGLLADVKYEAVQDGAAGPVRADRVVHQLPAPTEKLSPSGTVTIFIGRPS